MLQKNRHILRKKSHRNESDIHLCTGGGCECPSHSTPMGYYLGRSGP